jgi:hypothetical protein
MKRQYIYPFIFFSSQAILSNIINNIFENKLNHYMDTKIWVYPRLP